MPSCRITNNTSSPLNICLKQVTALHFENGVGLLYPFWFELMIGSTRSNYQIQGSSSSPTLRYEDGRADKQPGKVWFSLEALIDDGTKKSRYSILKSAATIALLSIAVGAVAATAGAAMLPAGVRRLLLHPYFIPR